MTEKLEKAVRDGNRAALLLDDPVLNEALDKLEEASIEAMMDCNVEYLMQHRADVQAIRNLRAALRIYMDGGIIAKRTLSPPN